MLLRRLLHRLALWSSLVLALFATPAFAFKGDTVPDWVRAAAAQPTASYAPETSAVVLLDDTTLTIGPDGRAVEQNRHVLKILRPAGREQGLVHRPFDLDRKLLSLHVWSIGPDGHEYQVKDNEMAEIGYPGSGNYYEDMRIRVANPPGRDPGGVVAYEYEQRLPTYMHEATWFFQDDLPHQRQSFTLELPPSYSSVAVWAHHETVKPSDLEHGRTRWEIASTPAINLDRIPLAPSLPGLAGRMTIHFGPSSQTGSALGSWQQVGAFYDQLARDRMATTPEMSQKVAELTAGKTDFYDKTEAIAEFVQKDIRYFVIEKGIGGQQPHPAADIFRNRYGDCKDKATLLAAMLATAGVHSTLVLVDTDRGFVDPHTPSVLGNHAIGAIEIPRDYHSPKLRSVVTLKSGRRFLIVDPTWDQTAFGQLEHGLQGSFGLIVEGTNSELVELPVLNPELNVLRRSATFQLAGDGSLKGEILESRFGDLSDRMRRLYSESDEKQRQRYFDQRMSQDFASFHVSDVKVENVPFLNKDVTTRFQLSADHFGRTIGPLLLVRPRVLGSHGFVLDHKQRTFPIDLEQTMVAKDDFTIQLPDGYALDEMPEPVNLDVGFAAYESATSLEGTNLHYHRTYTVRQVTLPADRYADLQKLETAIDADEQNHAVFKKK